MHQPFYKDAYTELYLGDSRSILPNLEQRFEAIITDPVWPNAPINMMFGSDAPYQLFNATAKYFHQLSNCVIIQICCNSDPRFLSAIHPDLPFFRACWLGYSNPNYKGNVVIDSNIAYVFGVPQPIRENENSYISGYINQEAAKMKEDWHPCPRQLFHVKWLINNFVSKNGLILDPFCGSGTTLVAAKENGRKAVGIEINELYAEKIANRLVNTVISINREL